MSDDIAKVFDERIEEIDAYLKLLEILETLVQTGLPRIGDEIFTTLQQRILYSSVYLQLYNLVEATASWCIGAVESATSKDSAWKPGDLTENVLREWVRSVASTHSDIVKDARLKATIFFCNRLLQDTPISEWKLEKGGGGNWDEKLLEDVAERIGVRLTVDTETYRNIKRHVRDDLGALGLIKLLRNKLAHGNISFSECGAGVTVADLRKVKEHTTQYLREVVHSFRLFLNAHSYLMPDKRPGGV
jgi:MAE_28990/MAE_18760-like HEPN